MNIENRMNDVIKLRANACQDLATFILPTDWSDRLYNVMVDALNGPYRDKYIEAYKKIKAIGIDKYNIGDMDVTLINTIFNEKRICTTTNKIRNLMNEVSRDRNLTNHSSSNEEERELYIRAIVSLNDVKDLVINAYDENIDKNLNIDSDKYDNYRKLYYKKIVDMQNLLIEESAASIGKDKIISDKIEWCLERPEVKNGRFESVCEDFQRLYSITDKEFLLRFLKKASDSGIEIAHYWYICTLFSNKEIFNYGEIDIEDIDNRLITFWKSEYREDLAFSVSFDFLYYLHRNNYQLNNLKVVETLKKKDWHIIYEGDKLFLEQKSTNKRFDGLHYISK